MNDTYVFSIGLIATILGLISFLPIIYVVYKTKDTKNFPFKSIFIILISNILWILYGIYKEAYVNIISSGLYFLIYAYILYIKFLY